MALIYSGREAAPTSSASASRPCISYIYYYRPPVVAVIFCPSAAKATTCLSVSTCALFAQYLYESGYPVTVLDADIQASLSRHRERELTANPDVAVPWEVSTIDTTDRQSLQSSVEEAKKFEGIVLVDMPGTLNASNLDLLYQAADLAVVPVSYDFDTVDATGIFIKVIKRVKDIQLVFLPNRINTTENRADDMKQREETVKIFGRIGRVTPRIKQSVVIKRYSTISALDKYQKAAVEHAFDAIVEQINV